MEDVEDCSRVQFARKAKILHCGIQTLITARSLEGTIINFIYYSYSPRRGDSFGGGAITVNYSTRKLYIIEK